MKLQKWIKWLKLINEEITQLVIARNIFWSVQEMIKKNKDIQKPSSFYEYLAYTYIAFIVMGIRRQIKNDYQSISLVRLLSEIAEQPQIISRKYFKSLYQVSAVEFLADNDFNQFCINSGDEFISREMVINDICHLREVARVLEVFADKMIAHLDKKKPKVIPSFQNVDETIEFLDKLYIKYHLMFHAESMETLMPVYQYDWKQIFDFPWRIKTIKRKNVKLRKLKADR
jgi:hypothetical protein